MGRKKVKRSTSMKAMLHNLGPLTPERLADPLGPPRQVHFDDGLGFSSIRSSYGGFSRPYREYAPDPSPRSGLESALSRQRASARPTSARERKAERVAAQKAGKKNGGSKKPAKASGRRRR